MDVLTTAIIETIGDAGFSVTTGADRHGNAVVGATDERTGEKFVVRGDDLYTTVLEMTQQEGIDLENGLPRGDRPRVARIPLPVDRCES